MASDIEDMSRQSDLAATFQMVARLWLSEVDGEMLEFLWKPAVAEAWLALGGAVPDQNTCVSETLDRMAEDYCQLLIGPKGHLPPVQSVWSDQVFQSEAAASTHRFYKLCSGYQPPASIDDHLGCQLDFVGFLLRGPASSTATTEVLELFCAEHLLWPERLLYRITEKATTDFYRGLAEVTRKLIADIAA